MSGPTGAQIGHSTGLEENIMVGTSPRLPEQFRDPAGHGSQDDDFNVSELVSEAAGAHSPFGDLEYPVPAELLAFYHHPTPAERPRLANGR
jgi:hypothetical protein